MSQTLEIKCYLCEETFEDTEMRRCHLLFKHGKWTEICYTSDYFSASRRLLLELEDILKHSTHIKYICLYRCNKSASRIWNNLPLDKREEIIRDALKEHNSIHINSPYGDSPNSEILLIPGANIPTLEEFILLKNDDIPTWSEKVVIRKIHSILTRLRLMGVDYREFEPYKDLFDHNQICGHEHRCRPFNINDYYYRGYELANKAEVEYEKMKKWYGGKRG